MLIEIKDDCLIVAGTIDATDNEEACHVMIIARPCIETIYTLEPISCPNARS
jgi:hypothetical protein